MRILVIHQYFLGEGDAGGSRWNQFAKYFAQAGHEVTVLAGMVHYASGQKSPKYKRHFFYRENPSPGVKVIRCHVSQSYNKSFIGRFWAYLSFAFSALIGGICCAGRPDVIIATSPPLTVALPMWLLSIFFACPAIFEVRDLWPESAVDTGVLKSQLLIWMSYKIEAMAYRRARKINVLTPAFAKALVEKKSVPLKKICLIPNGADLDIMQPGPVENSVRKHLGLEGKFVVSYFGAHGLANKLSQLIDAAELMKADMPDVVLMLVGDGMEKTLLAADARRRELENVKFVDAISKLAVPDYINASDVCTAVLMKNDTFKTVYPNKVFDYMCCARPIILGIDGVARKLIEESCSGIYVEPEHPCEFVAAVKRLRSDAALRAKLGQNGRRYVMENFDRHKLTAKYIAIISRLTGRCG